MVTNKIQDFSKPEILKVQEKSSIRTVTFGLAFASTLHARCTKSLFIRNKASCNEADKLKESSRKYSHSILVPTAFINFQFFEPIFSRLRLISTVDISSPLFQSKAKMISGRETVSIVELVFYIPCLFLSLIVARRHGFLRHLGWIYLTVFVVIRGTGAALQIVASSDGNFSLETGAVILSSIGLSPLLLCMCGLLRRVYVIHKVFGTKY